MVAGVTLVVAPVATVFMKEVLLTQATQGAGIEAPPVEEADEEPAVATA